MKLSYRAAGVAAATFCASALAVASTPGVALEVERTPLNGINLFNGQEVPTMAEALADLEQPAPVAETAEVARQLAEAAAQVAREQEVAEAEIESEAEPARRSYASLAAAVADQKGGTSADDELQCLAQGVYYESKGEPLEGQLAVAHVILNRTKSGRFPRSVCSVLKQRGQFSFVRGGQIPQPPANGQWRTAMAVAKVAQADMWESSVPRALFFHARYVSPGWRLARVGTVGNHVFYR